MASTQAGARALLARALSGAKDSLLLDRRRRGHLAVLIAVLSVSVFGYVLLEPRSIRVQADGRELEFDTHHSNDAAVLGRVGIDIGPGDRVTALDGGGQDVLRVDRARAVRLQADGMVFELLTHAATIAQLLDEAGVALSGRDSVLLAGSIAPVSAPLAQARLGALSLDADATDASPINIEVRRAVEYVIVEDGREVVSTSSRPTVAQALREAGVTVGPGDAVKPDAEAALVADARIEVRHANALTVALPDEHRVLYTLERTVGEAIEGAGITVPEGAFLVPPAETAVTPGLSVRVVQLSASTEFEREFVESRTVYRSDPSLDPGDTRVESGNDGVLIRHYDVSYVNGEEAGRTLIEEYYDPEPRDTVIYYPVQRGAGEAVPAEGEVSRTLEVYATYYTPASSGRAASDPAYGRTATGVLVTYGVVAVDPNVIPLGTRMFIPGYGYAIAADTGGAVKGYIIDLGYPDGVEVDWHSRWITIYILS